MFVICFAPIISQAFLYIAAHHLSVSAIPCGVSGLCELRHNPIQVFGNNAAVRLV